MNGWFSPLGFITSSPASTWLGPEGCGQPQLPTAPPHVWMKAIDWVFALSSLLPHLHCCGLITAGFIFLVAFFFLCQLYKCKSSFLTTGWLFSAGCCSVSCTASLAFTGFLGAFIEETFVIWLHSLELLKTTKRKNCLCVPSFYSCCLCLSFCIQLINSFVQCLEELLCQVSHLIDLLNAFMKTSSGNSIVIHYIEGMSWALSLLVNTHVCVFPGD